MRQPQIFCKFTSPRAGLLAAVLLLGLFVSGCEQPKPKESAAAAETVESTESTPSEPTKQAGAEARMSKPSAFAQCPHGIAPPCDLPVWLSCYPRTDVGEHYCAACADQESRCGDAESTLSTELTSADDIDGFRCEEYGYAIAAIQAWNGHKIEDPTWREYIRSRDWFADRGRVPYTKAARANLDELRAAAAKGCGGQSMKDRKLVADWFQTLATTGAPPATGVYFVDNQDATRKRFEGFISGLVDTGMDFDRRTTVWASGSGKIDTDDGKLSYARSVTVAPSSSEAMSCLTIGEDCEGYEYITLYFDKDDKLIAQSVMAAACPFVYVQHPDGRWQKQGEILRHLRKASLAGTQTLALQVGDTTAACDGPVRVRLSEEKEETTHLDAVRLEVGGQMLVPDACKAADAPAFCAKDGRHHLLHQGDRLDLTFSLPTDVTDCSAAQLRASGYYEPSP